MANQEQLELLQQSIEDWNTWREEHPEISPELSKAKLWNADLSGADLSLVVLSEADLRLANLTDADLREANLSEADLREANLSGANLREANLSGADLTDAYLWNANLSGANLQNANLSEAELLQADLSRADLSKANLVYANLKEASLRDANLDNADLRDANLDNADLSRANLSYATIEHTTFGNVNLQTVKGLETVEHHGPSTIGIDTIMRSEADIPEIFLRGIGVSDTFIEYIRSLVGKPIEYYTCFISYSSRDQEFVERLYADLQSKGVRCWYAPEDLKTGDKIRDRIDQSIRLHDKLLLVLSEHSVNSSWVEFEVEAAIAKENSKKTLMLFPIRLDSAIKDSPTSWAAHIRRTRNITDFSKWKQHDAYQKVLQRLLRDLKPEIPPVAESE